MTAYTSVSFVGWQQGEHTVAKVGVVFYTNLRKQSRNYKLQVQILQKGTFNPTAAFLKVRHTWVVCLSFCTLMLHCSFFSHCCQCGYY